MRVVSHPDAQAFLAATEGFRGTEPVLTNVIGSVAESVAAGRVYPAEFWYAVLDDDGSVIGCAIRTAPWFLSLSPMSAEAARALAAAVQVADPAVPGVTGPEDVAEVVIAALGRQADTHLDFREHVQVVNTLMPPSRPIDGTWRRGTVDDTDLLLAWLEEFSAEVGLPAFDLPGAVAGRLADDAYRIWTVDGAPVSLAGHASLVQTPAGPVARIGPVFTPSHLRGRGYASAVTAALTQELMQRCAVVMLFTDAANPTSNAVYARLGYEIVADVVEVSFGGSDGQADSPSMP